MLAPGSCWKQVGKGDRLTPPLGPNTQEAGVLHVLLCLCFHPVLRSLWWKGKEKPEDMHLATPESQGAN